MCVGILRVDFTGVGRLCYQDGHWYYRRRLVGLYQEIRLILLCLVPLTTLGSNLHNSAAPGGDYVTPMNNTHVLCVWLRYLQT